MTDEQAARMIDMLERCHDSLNVLLALTGLLLTVVIVVVSIRARSYVRVSDLLRRSEVVLKMAELHGAITDRNRERVISATDQMQKESGHVAVTVEETKLKLGEVSEKVDIIKSAVTNPSHTDGTSQPPGAKP